MKTLIDQRKIEEASKKYCDIKADLEKLQKQMKAAESDPERYLDLERQAKIAQLNLNQALKEVKTTANETVAAVVSQLPEIRRIIAQQRTQSVTISALDDVLTGVRELGYPKIAEKLLELAGGILGIDTAIGLGSQAKAAERRALEIEQAIRPLFQQPGDGEMLKRRLETSAIRGGLPYLP